jgi:hypothetical protein
VGGGLPGLGSQGGPQIPLDQLLTGLIKAPISASAPAMFSGGDPNTAMQIANQVTAPQAQLPTPSGPNPGAPTGPQMQPGAPPAGHAPPGQVRPGMPPSPPQAPYMPTGGPVGPSQYTFDVSKLAPQLAGLGGRQFTPPIRQTNFGM